MENQRSYRGFLAATTIGLLVSLTVLVVEKHLRLLASTYLQPLQHAFTIGVSTTAEELPAVDAGLAATEDQLESAKTSITRRRSVASHSVASRRLRRPPEPAAGAVLYAPIASDPLSGLPLHAGGSNLQALMQSIDAAFENPIQTASVRTVGQDDFSDQPLAHKGVGRSGQLRSGKAFAGQIPEPTQLFRELTELQQLISARSSDAQAARYHTSATRRISDLPENPDDSDGQTAGELSQGEIETVPNLLRQPMPSTGRPHGLRAELSRASARDLTAWISQVQQIVRRVVAEHGLESEQGAEDVRALAILAEQAREIGEQLPDYEVAQRVLRAGYAVGRRAAIWALVHSCLQSQPASRMSAMRQSELAPQEFVLSSETARMDDEGSNQPDAEPSLVANSAPSAEELRQAIEQAAARLARTGDELRWREYLLMDELAAWAGAADVVWQPSNHLATKVLTRLQWERLTEQQAKFLLEPEFVRLRSVLELWGRAPIDYRQLLTSLELIETEPVHRVRDWLAGAVQVLRVSGEPRQHELAEALNDHYRNANMRVSIAGELLQRLSPREQYYAKPVRQRILGADTRGDSAIRSELQLKLIPDPEAWHIGIGLLADMHSVTRSRKGPASFDNTSIAEISSQRFLRLTNSGYRISSNGTDVESRQFLRRMRTDYDGLPVIGDFVRLIAREQFDQQFGLAQRITRRLIAREADVELDSRLQESITEAETGLRERIVGPLESLQLNPIVVAMNTTPERLTVRYRVASSDQMAAHTPRPRAPTGNLISIQLHESAINNMIDSLQLGTRTWTLPELAERLGMLLRGKAWKIPEDVSPDIRIRFAHSRPATVEMQDGRLRLTLRIAELSEPGGLHIERFVVTSDYIPAAEGMAAELVRDGVVEIDGPALRIGDRLPLRVIFAKVFVSRPQIPLISQAWAEDPRAEGMAVSQVEIRDGWLAVAVSEADSPLAKQVAERRRSLLLE